MKKARISSIVLVLLLGLYIGSYLALSVTGRYEPATIGLGGVKSYGWAPCGFVSKYRWKQSMILMFFPLYYLDCQFWHSSAGAYGGKYPVNEVDMEDIWKVYDACR